MANPTYPGVYVEEISSGVRPIEAAGTSTCVFVGITERGPEEPKKLTSFSEYQKHFGDFFPDSYLAESVFQFFSNGGSVCYILRVTKSNAATALIQIKNRTGVPSPIDKQTLDDLTITGGDAVVITTAYTQDGDRYVLNEGVDEPVKEEIINILSAAGYASNGITFTAKNKGNWGNFLYLQIENGKEDPENEFKISVRKQIEADLEPEDNMSVTPLEVFDNLSMDKDAPNYAPAIINNNSLLISLDFDNDNLEAEKPFIGPGRYEGEWGISLLGDIEDEDDNGLQERRKFLINIDHDGWLEVEIPGEDNNGVADTETSIEDVAEAITGAVQDLVNNKKHTSTPDEAYENFLCYVQKNPDKDDIMDIIGSFTPDEFDEILASIIIPEDQDTIEGAYIDGTDDDGNSIKELDTDNADVDAVKAILDPIVYSRKLVLVSGTNDRDADTKYYTSSVQVMNASDPDADAASILGMGYRKGKSVEAHAALRPKTFGVLQIGDALPGGDILDAQPGSDGVENPTEYTNTYFRKLNNVKDISLLAVPGVGSPLVVTEAMGYCSNRELQDLFFIGDMSLYDDEPEEARDFRNGIKSPNSYGAVYFPWIMAPDPSGRSSELIALPPSGFIAGLYARIDARRGVWKAPAGTEAMLNNSMALTVKLTDVQQGQLNPSHYHINCIRDFPAAGIVCWGARTITSDPEYKYVPVRRMAIMLRVSIYNGIQWAVFEPNDEPLWAQLRMNIKSFMMTLFRKGAFQGSSADEAFFVKCDSETTTQDDINLGIVNIIVGFAPLKPAEFVIVKITQKAGQSS